VVIGRDADAMVNGKGRVGKDMSADTVAVTRKGEFMVSEAKGMNIEHGLDQLAHTASRLGHERVIRYELVIPERINSPGFTVEDGILMMDGARYLIHGKPVNVVFSTQK
jgi:hypothetical protein